MKVAINNKSFVTVQLWSGVALTYASTSSVQVAVTFWRTCMDDLPNYRIVYSKCVQAVLGVFMLCSTASATVLLDVVYLNEYVMFTC